MLICRQARTEGVPRHDYADARRRPGSAVTQLSLASVATASLLRSPFPQRRKSRAESSPQPKTLDAVILQQVLLAGMERVQVLRAWRADHVAHVLL
jgi:hypothetical protein